MQAIALAAMACLVVLAAFLATPTGREVVQGPCGRAPQPAVRGQLRVLVLARGVLLGAHALRRYAALLVGEALLRLVLIGCSWPASRRRWSGRSSRPSRVAGLGGRPLPAGARVDWSGGRTPWRPWVGRSTALGIANGLSALVLTGFPAVVVASWASPADLAVLIAVITLSRAPLALLAPVQALTVPTVVRWSRSGDTHRLSPALEYIAGGSAVAAVVGAAIGYVVGPWAVALVLGADYRPTR